MFAVSPGAQDNMAASIVHITAITYNISAQIVLRELFAAISLLKLELAILYSTLWVSKMDLLFQLNFGRRECTVLILTISESPSGKPELTILWYWNFFKLIWRCRDITMSFTLYYNGLDN